MKTIVARIISVDKWTFDRVAFDGLASHEGYHAALKAQVCEGDWKTESNEWNRKTLGGNNKITVRVRVDDGQNEKDTVTRAAIDFLNSDLCQYDIYKPEEVTYEDVTGVYDVKRERDVLLYCMNVIMRHLSNEEAQEPWLANGIPDGTAVGEPGEELVREIAEADITKDAFEFMLRTFVRTLATEVFPDVEFGKRYETTALY